MSAFAPEEAMSDSGTHPPLEELAAYIDGLLEEKEAARVAEHIAECEDCFFVYSETVRFQLEHPDEAEVPGPEVLPFPARKKDVPPQRDPKHSPAPALTKRRKTSPWWLGAAAAALLAIAIGIPLYRNFGPLSLPQVTTAELIEPVQGIPGIQDQLYKYKVPRGGPKEESEIDQKSFIIGSAFVDLRLSLQEGDVETSSALLHKIGASVKEIDISPDLGLSLIEKSQDLKSSADLQRLLLETEQWEAEISADDGKWYVNPDYIIFGKWAEAGRLAALLQKEEFFDSRENRRVLSYVLQSKEMAPDEDVVAQLQEIEGLWDKGNLQSRDFVMLAEKFEAILEVYDTLG